MYRLGQSSHLQNLSQPENRDAFFSEATIINAFAKLLESI